MKELFRDKDFTRVGYFQSILEAEDIPTLIRNEHLTASGLSDIPIPEFYPALCVMNDEDYVTAVRLIRSCLDAERKSEGVEITCPGCGETNPGNFDICWNCNGPLVAP